MAHVRSPQQERAVQWAKTGTGNAVVISVAGGGKTTLLIDMLGELAAQGLTTAMVAYNKAITVEIKERVAAKGFTSDIGTAHSFGFQGVRSALGYPKVDDKKLRDIIQKLAIPGWYAEVVNKLVSHAKNAGIGIARLGGDIDDNKTWTEIFYRHDLVAALPEEFRYGVDAMSIAINDAKRVLRRSNELAREVIDFDDMCYLPLLLDIPLPQFDFVLLDEAQDTNETRRALVAKMVKPTGRLVAVGDPHQAIYGFTGADNDSLDRIKRDFNAIELPLTVTYRCPKAVVRVAQQWVSHIEAHESAPEGEYLNIEYADLLATDGLSKDDAILCRKTAPLIKMAYALIRRGVPCKVEGRNIGNGLLKIIRKWKRVKTISALLDKVREWEAREIKKAMDADAESRVEAIKDLAECIFELASVFEGRDPVALLEERVSLMFGDDVAAAGLLTLATIHRSKGREWERVFWVGREAWQPSKMAKQQWQLDQEINLMYVAATRAKKVLVEVTAPPEGEDEKKVRFA